MNPGIAGSSAKWRGSPVRFPAPNVEPWYERYWLITLKRPVYIRAILIAFSFASAPPFVKKTFPKQSGSLSTIDFASFARGSAPNEP